MSREEEQFNIIEEGIIEHLEEKRLSNLRLNYFPVYDNSDVDVYEEVSDFSRDDQARALENVKYELIDELRAIFSDKNKALIMLEKIIENYWGR